MKDRLLRCTLLIAESTLKNIGTGLEMWFVDNDRQYPQNLLELTPNYLRQVLPGPGGSPEDWFYERSADGGSYSISTKGEHFSPLGIGPGYPRYDRAGGIEPKTPSPLASLDYRITLPPSLAGEWKEGHSAVSDPQKAQLHGSQARPAYWQRGDQMLLFRLTGPYSARQVGMAWVEHKVHEHSQFVGTKVDLQTPVQFGELSGIEVKCSYHHLRSHQFYLTDGELGWEFSYGAPAAEFDDAVDQAFVTMIENRQKP